MARRVQRWSEAVGFRPSWGTVRGVGRLNGSSSLWVQREVVRPLGVTHGETWIADCLDTYRASTSVGARLADTYGLDRLQRELREAAPELIVTLGNAALRGLGDLVDVDAPPRPLRVDCYGARLPCRVGDRAAAWLPLAHPGGPCDMEIPRRLTSDGSRSTPPGATARCEIGLAFRFSIGRVRSALALRDHPDDESVR